MGLTTYSAPSNIALIKYMGKTNHQDNFPTNSSISYTLEHLRTFVRIQKVDGLAQDVWAPLQDEKLNLFPLELSEKGKQKFLNHFQKLKELAQISAFYKISSANNFPSDCGIASSSSSFAALTLAAMTEFQKDSVNQLDLSASTLSSLSRKGSGSSCRSFFSPWCVWKTDRGEGINLPFAHLHHIVVLLDKSKKEVSSSEAHKRVTTSPIFSKRMEVIHKRFRDLISNLENSIWAQAREICWVEFEEMHQLFETSVPAFSYRDPKTFEMLKTLENWQKANPNQAPIVTMDAGSNIHLLFKLEDLKLAKHYEQRLNPLEMITSWGVNS